MFVNSKVSWAPMAFDVLAVVAQLSGALLWPLLQVILMVVMVMVVVMRMVVIRMIVMVVVMRMLVVVVMIRYDAQEDDNDAVNHLYDDEDVLMVVLVMIVMVVVMRIQSDA